MNELVIDGRIFTVEQEDFDELTVFGQEATAFITDIIKAGRHVVVSKPGYQAEKAFLRVLEVGLINGVHFIRVESLTLRLFNGANKQ